MLQEAGLTETLKHDVAVELEAYASTVDCAYVFGSATRGVAGPLSDLDVGLLFRDSLSPEARAEITTVIAGQVQRLAGPVLDVTILNEAPPALKHRVIRDGALIFVSNERRRVRFEASAIREYLDFQPVLERYDRALLTRAREGRLGA